MTQPAPRTRLKNPLEADVTDPHRAQPVSSQFARLGAQAFLAVVLTLLGLSGCGPGTGGTGVGPASGPASASMAYSGTTTLTSSPAVTNPASVPPPGSDTPGAGCTANCTTSLVTLKLEPEAVQLQGSCFDFTSYAPLAPAASTLTVVPGTYQKFTTLGGQTVASSIPANLFLQFASGQSDSTGVNLSVRDTADAVLFGPVTLQRTDVASAMLPNTASPARNCP